MTSFPEKPFASVASKFFIKFRKNVSLSDLSHNNDNSSRISSSSAATPPPRVQQPELRPSINNWSTFSMESLCHIVGRKFVTITSFSNPLTKINICKLKFNYHACVVYDIAMTRGFTFRRN